MNCLIETSALVPILANDSDLRILSKTISQKQHYLYVSLETDEYREKLAKVPYPSANAQNAQKDMKEKAVELLDLINQQEVCR